MEKNNQGYNLPKQKLLRALIGFFYKEGCYYKILFDKMRNIKLLYRDDVSFHALFGLIEKESKEILLKVIEVLKENNRGIVVADAGASLGYYSPLFWKYLPKASKIFSFEPHHVTFEILQENLIANNASNVELQLMACSEKSSDVTFYVSKYHARSSLLSEWLCMKILNRKSRLKQLPSMISLKRKIIM